MTYIVHQKESYKLMGILFKVYNELGPIGYLEKHYQKSVESELKKQNIAFVSQREVKLNFEDEKIGKYFIDLIVGEEGKEILLEIKKSRFITLDDIRQVQRYLTVTKIKLGIIANFGRKNKLQYKRIINLK